MNICRVPLIPPDEPHPRRETNVAAPLPRPFDFGFTARTPLVPLPAAVLFLNRKQRSVMALIESGELRWAFDIRSAGASTREVRVLRDSLFEFTGLRERGHRHESDEREFAEIIEAVLPESKKGRPRPACTPGMVRENVLPGPEVAQCLACSHGHVRKLLQQNLLRAPGRRTPGNTVFVVRGSVVEFLWKRRMI